MQQDDEGEKVYRLIDLAPTTAALLQLPVPRQATGEWIDPDVVLSHVDWSSVDWRRLARDLFEAKRERTNVFLLESSFTSQEWCRLVQEQPLLDQRLDQTTFNVSSLDLVPVPQWLRAAQEVEEVYQDARSWLLTHAIVRNVLFSALLVFFLLYYFYFLVVRYTTRPLLGHLAVLRCMPTVRRVYVVPQDAANAASVTIDGDEARTMLRDLHIQGILGALAMVLLYLATEMTWVLGYYATLGYSGWDSTLVHSVAASVKFLVVALVPGFLVLWFLLRLVHVPYLAWDRASLAPRLAQNGGWRAVRWGCLAWANCCRIVCLDSAMAAGHVADPYAVVLLVFFRVHLMGWTLVLWGILFILQGTYSFLIPGLLSNWILTDTTWTLRFRIISVQLMAVPLLVAALVGVCSLSRRNARDVPWDLVQSARRAADAEKERQAQEAQAKRRRLDTRGGRRDGKPQDAYAAHQALGMPLTDLVPHADYSSKQVGTSMFVGTL